MATFPSMQKRYHSIFWDWTLCAFKSFSNKKKFLISFSRLFMIFCSSSFFHWLHSIPINFVRSANFVRNGWHSAVAQEMVSNRNQHVLCAKILKKCLDVAEQGAQRAIQFSNTDRETENRRVFFVHSICLAFFCSCIHVPCTMHAMPRYAR